jgi:hypothetical protein
MKIFLFELQLLERYEKCVYSRLDIDKKLIVRDTKRLSNEKTLLMKQTKSLKNASQNGKE